MNKAKEIERLRTAIAVRASILEKELERQGIVDGFDATTTKREARRLLPTVLSAERRENGCVESYFYQPHGVTEFDQERRVTAMEWDLFKSEDGSGNWVVQAMNFDGEGEIYTVTFSDLDREARAREYYNWKTNAADGQVIHAVKPQKTAA